MPHTPPTKFHTFPLVQFHATPSVHFHPHHARAGKKGRERRKRGRFSRQKVDTKELKKSLSVQKKSFLDLLFKLSTVDGKSVEDPNNDPGVISCIRDTGSYLKVWAHVFKAKDAFPDIRMAQLDTPDQKKL